MNLKSILAFLPLIVFGFVGHLVGAHAVGWVALAAAALAVGLAASSGRAGFTPVSISSFLTLSGLGVAALVGGDQVSTNVSIYGTGILALVVGITMLATVATTPFTEQSARASVPQEYWDSPIFRSVNRRISTGWALATIGCGVSRFVYVALLGPNPNHATPTGLLLGFGVPILLCYLAFVYTTRVSHAAHAEHQHQTA